MSPEPQHARARRVFPLAIMGPVTPVRPAEPPRQTRRQQRRRRRDEHRSARQQARAAVRARRKAADWTRPQVVLANVLAVLTICITIPAFASLYHTTTALLGPTMHDWARIVPVCGEIAFTYLFLNGVLLALRRAPAGVLRSAFMAALMAGAVALQALASRGSVPALIGHEVVVTAFFGVLLSAKATILTLLGGKVKPDRITLAEWAARPVQSARLWRWRATWGQMKVAEARERYMRLLYVTAITQADPRVGSAAGWEAALPVTLRYGLSTGQLPAAITAGEGDWQQAAQEHVRSQLSLLSGPRPGVAPGTLAALAPGEPESTPEASPRARPEARPEARSGPALKLAASKSRGMSASELEPHVAAMLEAYGDVSQVQVKRDLHVSTDKAREALRMAKRNRTVVQIGASR